MATSFQPETPHGTAQKSTGASTLIWTGVISSLLVIMLFALGLPHLLVGYEGSWAITLGAGLITFLLVMAVGFFKQKNTTVVKD